MNAVRDRETEVDYDTDETSEGPYCECDLEPTQDEKATMHCAACGKPLCF